MLYDTTPLNHSDTSSLYQSYSRLRRHPDRGWLCSLTRDQQYRRAVHAAHHYHHLLGTNLWVQMTTPLQTRGKGRLTILRRASLDQDSPCRSDHSHPYHTTLGLGSRVSEPKGGIDVLKGSSSPDSVGEGATPAGTPSAGLPASSPLTEVLSDPEGFGLTVAAIKPTAVNS